MRRTFAATVAVVVVAAGFVLSPTPASASLSNLSLVASNNQISATAVTLTISFQVGLADAAIVVTLPSGVTGLATANTSVTTSANGTTFSAPSLAVSNPKLLSADGQSVALNLLAALTATNWATVTITGLTNPSSAGGVTVNTAGKLLNTTQTLLDSLTVDETLGITYTVVALATNGISSAVGVAPTLGFTAGASSRSWSLDPSGTATSTSQTETLTVITNATSYVIQGAASGNLVRAGSDGSSVKDRIEYDGASGAPHFGYKVTPPAGDDPGGAFATTFRPWSTTSTNLVSGWSLTGLTNSEVTTITYDVRIDYTKAPGSYTGTVTYRVVPTY